MHIHWQLLGRNTALLYMLNLHAIYLRCMLNFRARTHAYVHPSIMRACMHACIHQHTSGPKAQAQHSACLYAPSLMTLLYLHSCQAYIGHVSSYWPHSLARVETVYVLRATGT